jgi:hypothetical protein
MNRNQTKIFLQALINAYPGYKRKIVNREALLNNWQVAFERVEFKDMMKAVEIWTSGRKLFPSVDEFARCLSLVNQEQSRTTRTFNFETSGCTVCPYLEEGQHEPCKRCMFEGGKRRYDKGN